MGAEADARGKRRRLLLLASGVLVFHTAVTILEEKLFKLPNFTSAAGGAFMTLFMYSVTVLAYLPRTLRSGATLPDGSRTALLRVSTLYVGTTTLTKTSLRYIDMPTQTILKSAKLLPVMAGSIIILRKRYSLGEWLSACMLVCGIVVFNLSTHFPEFRQTAAGSACICVALFCDSLVGNYQQKVMGHGVSADMLMFYQSLLGAVYMLVICCVDGTLAPGLGLLLHDPTVGGVLLLWSLVIILGTALVLQLVQEFSAVTAIVVTTVRKALTLVASFILFPKALGLGHPLGAALVFGSAFVAQRAKKAAGGKSARKARVADSTSWISGARPAYGIGKLRAV